MAIYSARFFIQEFEGPDPVYAYTVPAGQLAVVRTIVAHDPHGNCLSSMGTAENPYLIGVDYVPGSEQFHATWNGYVVFNPGEEMWISANDNDTVLSASGYLLYLM